MAAPSGGYSQFAPPRPPEDQEVANIIDKLAVFVARNGPEFEQMTKNKQRDNAKFSFLFGGEHNAYYHSKVAQERSAMYPSAQIPPLMPLMSGPPPPPPPPSQRSYPPPPQPLMAQSTSQRPPWLPQQQAPPPAPHLHQAMLQDQAILQQGGISDPLELEFSRVVQPVMESCTKDAIAAGKGWIFAHCSTAQECRQITNFLVRKTLNTSGVGFNEKLHIIYLINDVIHHCLRKGAEQLQQAIGEAVVQIFFNVHCSDPSKSDSLLKVLKIWEGHKYFPESSLQQVRAILTPRQPEPLPPASSSSSSSSSSSTADPSPSQAPSQWQAQPGVPPWQQAPPPWQPPQQPFGAPPPPRPPPWGPPPWPRPPANQPVPLFPQQQEDPPPPPPPKPLIPEAAPVEKKSTELEQERLPPPPPPLMERSEPRERNLPPPPEDGNMASSSSSSHDEQSLNQPSSLGVTESIDYNHGEGTTAVARDPEHAREVIDYNHKPLPPWGGASGGSGLPPAPPPTGGRFPPDPHWAPPIVNMPPPIPYFDLPAGLIAPLVLLHEHSYRPLNPLDVRLPPPQPPTDRLLAAVEEFYLPETEDKLRNSDGWEARALLDFYDAKYKAKEAMAGRYRRKPPPPQQQQQQQQQHRGRRRSRSRSRSPRSRSRSPPPHRKRRRSYSRSRSNSRSHSRSNSRSRSHSRSRRRRSSRSPTSSRSRSRSRSPVNRRRRSRSRSRSPFIPTVRSPRRRSSSPSRPFFSVRGGAAEEASSQERQISEVNVGHKLLKKMGWEGAGLGSLQQGIQEPIKGGEVRGKADKYKGVGVDNQDPFEQFRLNKSYTYNRRGSPEFSR